MKKQRGPFAEGFFGSFRLAAALVMALVTVISTFVNEGPNAAYQASKHTEL